MSWAALGMQAADRLIGNLSDTYGTGKGLRDEKREEEMGDYLERERRGIQARVEGAKAAGLHPLVALGYQSGPGPSSVVGGGGLGGTYSGGGDSGTLESPPPKAELTEDQDRMNKARVREAEANAELAEINAHNAMRALATQPGQPIGTMVGPSSTSAVTSPLNLVKDAPGAALKPGIKLKPDEVTMGKGGVTAGTHQAGTAIELPNGETWRIPSTLAAEGLEDLDLAKYYLLWQLNKEKILDSVVSFGKDTYSTWRKHLDKIPRPGGDSKRDYLRAKDYFNRR